MAKFVFKRGKEEEVREGDRGSIGTRSTCSFTLDDPLAADVHCDIVLRNDEFVVIDRGSSMGTYVNGLVAEAPIGLKDGDEIVIAVSRISVTIKEGEITLAVDRSRFYYDDKKDALDLSRREVGFGRFRPVSVGNWLVAFAMILLFPLSYCGSTSDYLLEPGDTWHSGVPEYREQLDALIADGHFEGMEAGDRDCNACHSPLDSSYDVKCMVCHEEDVGRPGQHPAYASVGDWEESCVTCHIDHRGTAESVLIARTADESCGLCHSEDQQLVKPRDYEMPSAEVAIDYNTFTHAGHFGKKVEGRDIACNDCHVAYEGNVALAARAMSGPRARDFSPVDYGKCMECHGKEAPEKRRFEPTWHPKDADDRKECWACHAEGELPDLKMIPDFEVKRHYALSTRPHAEQRKAGHMTADGRACADCHRNGAELEGSVEREDRPFEHGVHVPQPWPGDLVAKLRLSGNQERPREGECVACHAQTARSNTIETAVPQQYSVQSCGTCHTGGRLPQEGRSVEPAPDRPDFPHDRHLKVEGGCWACHTFPTGGTAAVPVTPLEVRTCVKCHTEHDSIAGGHCDDCHKKKDPAMSGKPLLVVRRPDPTYKHFSPGHRDWTEEGRCADCHGDEIWKAKTIEEIANPEEDAPVCVQCHVKDKARFHWR